MTLFLSTAILLPGAQKLSLTVQTLKNVPLALSW